MDIGKRIKFYRNNAGLTQEELANKACMSRSYLADVERKMNLNKGCIEIFINFCIIFLFVADEP